MFSIDLIESGKKQVRPSVQMNRRAFSYPSLANRIRRSPKNSVNPAGAFRWRPVTIPPRVRRCAVRFRQRGRPSPDRAI